MKPVAFLLLYFVFFTIKAQDVQWAGPSVDFNNGKLKVAGNQIRVLIIDNKEARFESPGK